jgi:hypothetical protein
MNAQFVQNIRYKLQKRVRRLNSASPDHFLYELQRFWVFFDEQAILRGLGSELIARTPSLEPSVETIFNGQVFEGSTEQESAAIGMGVLRRFSKEDKPDAFYRLVLSRGGNYGESLDSFRSLYLEPFYEYIDENLDDRNYVLFLLTRYKRRSEWFERDRLYRAWEGDTKRGEKFLALDLYEYLYAEGVDFQIEPWSVSGEADMVASQSSGTPFIADAKIFNPEKGKGAPYLRQAFQQIYQYTCDHNQPTGYLVIFSTCDKRLSFDLRPAAEPIPRLVLNNKTVFFMDIDLFPHTEPASRRQSPEHVRITEQEIIDLLNPASG